MEPKAVTRRLAAILIADVVGYSRLMERDDTGTFARLGTIRDEVVDPAVVSHDGRIVKTAGDGFLAEFPSALAALRASVQIQREMAKRNEGSAADDRFDYRIGVNLGDVMDDGDEIAGDGINVASRLESLALPGGICVSSSVREQVHGQMLVEFEDIGEQRVKNIGRSVRVYAVTLMTSVDERTTAGGRRRFIGARLAAIPLRTTSRRAIAAGLVTVAIAVCVVTVWRALRPVPLSSAPAMSVGVVPLAAAIQNPASSALRESISRDIGTQLARASSAIRIVPTTSSIAGAADATTMRGIASQSRVRYLLDGDVRQGNEAAEARLRLVDGETGEQRWSETIILKDPADGTEARRALRSAMGHLADRLLDLETRRAGTIDERMATPMELVLRARPLRASGSLAAFRKMESLCETALRREPELGEALRCISLALDGELDLDSTVDRAQLVNRMDEVSARAVKLNRGSSKDWEVRSGVLMYMGRWDAALEASAMALALDPDGADSLEGRAWLMTMMGKPAEAVRLAHEAIAMDPPGDWWVVRAECEALLLLGQYVDAVAACERAAGRSGAEFDIAYFLAAAYAHTGNQTRASQESAKILRASPGFTIAKLRGKQYSTHPDYLRLAEEHWYSGLRAAGIAEK